MKFKLLGALLICIATQAQALELKVCEQEKQIAACDKDISNMDDTLSILYQYVYSFGSNKEQISKNSEDFKSALMACDGKECYAEMFANQIGFMFDNLDESITVYGVEDMKGLWYGTDVRSFTNYGSMIFTDQFVYWGVTDANGNALLSSNNKKICRAKYSVVDDQIGTSFVDQLGRQYEIKETNDFETKLLKIESSTCDGADFTMGGFRFTVNHRNMRALNLIEYNKDGKATNWMSFTR